MAQEEIGTGVASEPDIEPNIDSQTPDKESLDLAAKFNMPHHALRILTQAGPVTNLPTEPLGEFPTADDKPPAPILNNQTQEQPGSDVYRNTAKPIQPTEPESDNPGVEGYKKGYENELFDQAVSKNGVIELDTGETTIRYNNLIAQLKQEEE